MITIEKKSSHAYSEKLRKCPITNNVKLLTHFLSFLLPSILLMLAALLIITLAFLNISLSLFSSSLNPNFFQSNWLHIAH